LDSRLRSGQLINASEIIGFCRYLRARRVVSIVGSINSNGEEQSSVLSPKTFNAYVHVVEDFLIWAADQFSSASDVVRDQVSAAKERVKRAFRSLYIGGKSAPKEGLADEDLAELRKVIKPGAKQNPFKKTLQYRNYLIVELMLATGIRRGELLKLKISHLPQGPKTTLTIERSPDDRSDPRRREPQVKTREREIPIHKTLAIDLWKYVQAYRRKGKHPYLFTSNRDGMPLDAGGVNWIFSFLAKKCFPHLKGRLHPHIMRHTFNSGLLARSEALGWNDDQRQKVQKYLNGWTEESNMPEVYTRKIIAAKAMELAEEYQRTLYLD
jgi:integrase